MKWTSKPPTKEGFYFFRIYDDEVEDTKFDLWHGSEVVPVATASVNGADMLMFKPYPPGSGVKLWYELPAESIYIQWAGPIEEPEDIPWQIP